MIPCESTPGVPEVELGAATRKFTIHLGPDVFARLSAEAWMAFRRVPRRGLEIGGILLGRKHSGEDGTTFWVEGFQPIESEHRSGPSYVLSDSDLALLEAALIKNGEAGIGIYRSHTRSERPTWEAPDIQLLERCFPSANPIFLMLGPLHALAAFYVRAEGNMTGVHELAMASAVASIMAGRSASQEIKPIDTAGEESAPSTRRLAGIVRAAVNQPAPAPTWLPALKPKSRSGRERLDWSLAIATAVLVVAISAGVLFGLRRTQAGAAPRPLQYVRLTVQRTGESLNLLWDRNAPAILGATRAILHIDDGSIHSDQNLSPAQLASGGFTYQPKNSDQTFRLDLFSAEPNGVGTLQVMNMTAPTPIPTSVPEQPPATLPVKASSLPSTPAARPQAVPPVMSKPLQPTAPSFEGHATPVVAASVETSPAPAPERAPVSTFRPVVISPINRSIAVETSMEPVSGSRFGHLMAKIPLVHHLAKQRKTVAPVAAYQPRPEVRMDERLNGPVLVDVKVEVAETGLVRHAEVVEFGDPPNWALVDAALSAAQRWTFEPARVEDTAVPSKVILHFRFTP